MTDVLQINDRNDAMKAARSLHFQGFKVAEIAKKLNGAGYKIAAQTIYGWRIKGEWDRVNIETKGEICLEAALLRLYAKPDKTESDLKTIKAMGEEIERMQRIAQHRKTGRPSDLNPKALNGSKAKAEKRNCLSEENIEALKNDFFSTIYPYQQAWWDAQDKRTRIILKSRQIGATWYFAREALLNAAETGENQIFMSASKAQAYIFRQYIVDWVSRVTDVKLVGAPISLKNGAHLYFLGTNGKTAQGYHGHVYMDEFAWIHNFEQFNKVAGAMATHKKWRKTYFSTPSILNHDSYSFWSGGLHNKGKSGDDRIEFDTHHANTKKGAIFPDGAWRQTVTIHDAEKSGCDLFDINQLRLENNENDFQNLFECVWVDDSAAVFSFEKLKKCMVEAWDWTDSDLSAARPVGNLPVMIGHDPAENSDHASMVVIVMPTEKYKAYRIIEKINVSGKSYPQQAALLSELIEKKYNVQKVAIDMTGTGHGVYQLVREFYPRVTGLRYDLETKNNMVLKTEELIRAKKLIFDAGWTDVANAFMRIRRTTTKSGKHMTYTASRSKETGHSDVAWAIMNCFSDFDFKDIAKSELNNPYKRTNRVIIGGNNFE